MLDSISKKHKNKVYGRNDSAMSVYGSHRKNKLIDTHQMIRYFDMEVQDDGYWNFNHMALQNEDCVDVLREMYPSYDIYLLMNQSSSHGNHAPDALHTSSMSVKCVGGNQLKMNATIV